MSTPASPPTTTRRRTPMGSWRLEWLRMTRSPRGIALTLVYIFFGLTGPLMAKYLPEIAKHAANGITIIVPKPTPADGLANYIDQIGQTGIIVVVAVVAGALTLDSRRGLSIFYRTRVPSTFALLWPRYVVGTATAVCALALGTAAAWYETTIVLGGLPAGRMLLGTACEAVYLAFAVAVVAAAATFGRGALATVGISLAVLLLLPIAGTVDAVNPWLPTSLATAPVRLVPGAAGVATATGSATADAAKAAAVAVLATAALLALAVRRSDRREI